jgi:opacity protein-like surface antigen
MTKLFALLVSLPLAAAAQTSRPGLDAAAFRDAFAMRTAPVPQFGTRAGSAGSTAVSKYFFARAGAIVPKHDDLEGFDTGLAFEGGLGFRTSPNFAFELAAGRYAVTRTNPVFEFKQTAAAIPVTGTAKLIAPAGKVEAYGLVGAGVQFASVKREEGGSDSDSDHATAFAFHFGGGLSAALSPNLTFSAELKYVIAKAKLFDEDVGLDSLVIGGGLGYRF